MKFTLEIELGNDGMQSIEEIESAIHKSLHLAIYDGLFVRKLVDSEKIWDENGNTVGKWQVTA